MSGNIAVIGKSDSIEYFRVLGCKTWETENGELTPEEYQEVLACNCQVVLVTEEVFFAYRDLIQRIARRPLPIVLVIPDVDGAIWTDDGIRPGGVAADELRKAIVKAIGQEISSPGEG
jgi:vacuolar-type H+-ATPase subunit F/Vma7